jgi:GH18 family chitinase
MGFRIYTQKVTILLFLIIPVYLFSQDFKVIGYLPHHYFDLVDKIDLSKITHLNLAFANPDKSGNLNLNAHQIQPIIQKARKTYTKVCLSVGGGALLPEWWTAWQYLLKPRNRSTFINKLIQYIRKNKLHGIDVDLEWSYVNEDYSGFILELRDSLDLYDLALTAALPAIHRYPNISDEALAVYDWINVMAYDLTGPWSPNKSEHHSPYSFAEKSIDFWKSQGVESRRLTLGLPFYGWNFSNKKDVHSVTFGEMVAEDPSNSFLDQIGATYFNGIPTIKAKTELAKNEVSGVMLWQLGQDAFNEYSLLKAIDEEIKDIIVDYSLQKTDNSTIDYKSETAFEIYPNPFLGWLHIRPENNLPTQIILTDGQGREVLNKVFTKEGSISINTGFLSKGFYYMIIINDQRVISNKLIKH